MFMKTLSFGNKVIICISIGCIKEPAALWEFMSGCATDRSSVNYFSGISKISLFFFLLLILFVCLFLVWSINYLGFTLSPINHVFNPVISSLTEYGRFDVICSTSLCQQTGCSLLELKGKISDSLHCFMVDTLSQ